MKKILTLTLFTMCFFAQAQDCDALLGFYRFEDANSGNYMFISYGAITDYSALGTVFSSITWDPNNDCKFTTEIQTIDIPDFPYNVGHQFNVTINNVDDGKIYITTTTEGKSWSSVLVGVDWGETN